MLKTYSYSFNKLPVIGLFSSIFLALNGEFSINDLFLLIFWTRQSVNILLFTSRLNSNTYITLDESDNVNLHLNVQSANEINNNDSSEQLPTDSSNSK